MGPAFYIMAILGCGDGQAACQQVRVIETQYASVDACNAAMSTALMAATDLPFPEVSAQCRAATAPAMAAAVVKPRGYLSAWPVPPRDRLTLRLNLVRSRSLGARMRRPMTATDPMIHEDGLPGEEAKLDPKPDWSPRYPGSGRLEGQGGDRHRRRQRHRPRRRGLVRARGRRCRDPLPQRA